MPGREQAVVLASRLCVRGRLRDACRSFWCSFRFVVVALALLLFTATLRESAPLTLHVFLQEFARPASVSILLIFEGVSAQLAEEVLSALPTMLSETLLLTKFIIQCLWSKKFKVNSVGVGLFVRAQKEDQSFSGI